MQKDRTLPGVNAGDLVQNFELLLGLSFTLGRTGNEAPPPPKDSDGDGYTNLEEYLNGTEPTKFVDYTKPENNVNTLK